MSDTLAALLTGLFGGAGATLLWEIVLKPARDQRNIAEVLAAEVSINMHMVAAAFVGATPDKVPPDFSLSKMVFDSITDQLGLLPPDLIGEVVFLYRYFEELNRIPPRFEEYVERLRDPASQDPARQRVLRKELQSCVDVFNSYLDKVINRMNIVQPKLLAVAGPWWSIRARKRRPSKTLDLSEVSQRSLDALTHRGEIAATIRRRGEAK